MKKLSYLFSIALFMFFIESCNDDSAELQKLENDRYTDSVNYVRYKDSLQYVMSLEDRAYKRYIDSLARVDSLSILNGENLPFTYNVLVFDGSNTSVSLSGSEGRSAVVAFDEEVTITITQFGVSQTLTTTDGLVSFQNVGRGIINGSISAANYTTIEFAAETLIKPSQELISNEDYLNYVENSALSHSFAIFSLSGDNTSKLIGRATAETDLTNSSSELAPEGTTFLASIDVDNSGFRDRYITNRNKVLFTDNIISFGYSPVFKSSIDVSGDYSFNLPASPDGLPIKLTYSDFIADQVAFVQDNGDLTERTASAVYGPDHLASSVPTTTLAPTVVFEAGGGASATAEVSGTGSITALNLVNGGQNFQGVPAVIIAPPLTVGGTQATATATVSNGVVSSITLTNGGSGYTADPLITITEGSGAAALVTRLNPIDIQNGSDVGGGVGTVQLANSGIYWSNGPVAPFVLFNGVLEGTAAGVPDVAVTMNNQGNIRSIAVNDRGFGYTAAPTISFSVGQNASAQVSAVNGTGSITAINITNPGQYYAAVDQILVSSSGGSGAQLTVQIDANINFGISAISIDNGGTGYSIGDPISFTTALVSAASASAVWEGQSIESYQINSSFGGTVSDLYINNPLIVFGAPDYNGPGARRAQGTAVITNGRLTGINITDNGSGYYAIPSLSILSGSGASVQSDFDEMKISGFNIIDQGAGYLAAPDVIIVDQSGAGSGAVATASITDGRVTSITLTDAGSGYINTLSIDVVFLDPGTTYDVVNKTLISNLAEATIEVTDGVITAVNVISAGDNYKAADILVESTKGSGFEGTVNINGGRIAGVVVSNGGVGYLNGNNPGVAASFSGASSYSSLSGITRVLDVNYGTGQIR